MKLSFLTAAPKEHGVKRMDITKLSAISDMGTTVTEPQQFSFTSTPEAEAL